MRCVTELSPKNTMYTRIASTATVGSDMYRCIHAVALREAGPLRGDSSFIHRLFHKHAAAFAVHNHYVEAGRKLIAVGSR